MSENNSQTLQIDSLVANEFAVELDGTRLYGVFRISGMTPFMLNEENVAVSVPFQLAKMVQRDGNNVFNKWLRETVAAKSSGDRPTRTVAVVAIDDGVETRRWTFTDAYIAAVAYSDFDSASSEMVEETITIHYAAVEETWSATPNLD